MIKTIKNIFTGKTELSLNDKIDIILSHVKNVHLQADGILNNLKYNTELKDKVFRKL